MKSFLFLILFMTYCLPVYSGDIEGKACLKKGKNELESGKYEDAISSLSKAQREFPLLGDYTLLWLSDAYSELGNHKESLKTIRSLLNKYPNSPLIKRARVREIKEAEEVSEENIQQIYEAYIREYPKDTEMKYLYAKWLKQKGKTDIAKSIFKDIYVGAGPLSTMAYNELSSSEISVEDIIERASNLIKRMDFKGAETALRHAMMKDEGILKDEILKHLGFSLFRQKKYLEAAEVYKEAKERYWEVRSLYRAGEDEVINSALDELLKSGDKRVSSLITAIASDERRDGDIEEAVRMYQTVIEHYPSETEDALQGIGWTYFYSGEYRKASDIFARLYSAYHDTKYLYWKARSLEADGEDALSIYHEIIEKEPGFYSIMSYARTKLSLEQSNTNETQTYIKMLKPVKGIPVVTKKIDRIEALVDLDLPKEALSELVYISKKTSSIEDILYICSKLQELGEYKHLVRLALNLPYTEELHHFRYPLAYWDIVEGLSKRYNIDPHLVLSVVREESRFDSEARSIAGALGLMQLMPRTASRLDKKLKLGINSSHEIIDVKNNLHIGVYYLSYLIKEFGSYTYAIAAYNAGEETVRKWLQNGNYKSVDEFVEDIPYSETKNYVKRVIHTFFEYKRFSLTGDRVIEISLEKL